MFYFSWRQRSADDGLTCDKHAVAPFLSTWLFDHCSHHHDDKYEGRDVSFTIMIVVMLRCWTLSFVLLYHIYFAPPPPLWAIWCEEWAIWFGGWSWSCLCARLSMIGRQVPGKVGLIHLWTILSFPWSLLEKCHAHSLTLKCRLVSHWQILFTPHPTSPSPQSLQWLVQKYICHSLPTLTAPQLHRSTKCFLMVVNYSLITRKG